MKFLNENEVDSLYIEKVNNRLASLQKMPIYKSLESFIYHHTGFDSLANINEFYQAHFKKIKKRNKLTNVALISHGDPCFSNIIYDRKSNLIKFIDPRGANDKAELYMHELYDIAKISHSILGNYDFGNSLRPMFQIPAKMVLKNLRHVRVPFSNFCNKLGFEKS